MRTPTALVAVVAGIVSMLVSCSTAPRATKPTVVQAPSPSAESLLERMADAYGSARSYADSGVVYNSTAVGAGSLIRNVCGVLGEEIQDEAVSLFSLPLGRLQIPHSCRFVIFVGAVHCAPGSRPV